MVTKANRTVTTFAVAALTLTLVCGAALAEDPPAPASPPAEDPFSQLKVVVPKDKLPPITSVRVRDQKEQADRARDENITTAVRSSPRGAAVFYGGKLLGNTPLSMSAKRGSTPLDVVIKARGYMTLHTRLSRKVNRSYFYKLTPAKIR